MSNIVLKITGLVSPKNPEKDLYPVTSEEFHLGGYKSVDTLESLYRIPVEKRKYGMLVFVQQENKFYRLDNNGSDDLSLDSQWTNVIFESNFDYIFFVTESITVTQEIISLKKIELTHIINKKMLISVMLNGLTLRQDIDYTVDNNHMKRILLKEQIINDISLDDVFTIHYYTITS